MEEKKKKNRKKRKEKPNRINKASRPESLAGRNFIRVKTLGPSVSLVCKALAWAHACRSLRTWHTDL